MSTFSEFVRETLLVACGIGFVIVTGEAVGLWAFGAFSWIWFARLVLAAALVTLTLLLFVLWRSLRSPRMRVGTFGARRDDHAQGCTFAFLISFVTLGLFVCGGLLEWLLELR